MEKKELKTINSLIVKVGKGDEDALRQLYYSIGGRLLSVALGITKDKQLAEDSLQETMIKVVKYANTFRKQVNGYGWICTIVRNEALSIIRKYRPSDLNIDEFFNLSDFAAADKSQKKLEVEIAVKLLTLDEQQLIWLRYMCDMTIREISAKLSVPRSTIMTRLQKAEEKLKKELQWSDN